MFSAPSYHKSFASINALESSLEILCKQIIPQARPNIYALLWELGSNVLKYGTKTFPKPTNNYSSLDSNIIYFEMRYCFSNDIQTKKVRPIFLQILCSYQTPLDTKYYILPQNHIQTPYSFIYTNPPILRICYIDTAESYTPKAVPHHNGLGHKVIKYFVQNFCYDMPKIFILSATKRTLCVRIKGAYLAHKYGI